MTERVKRVLALGPVRGQLEITRSVFPKGYTLAESEDVRRAIDHLVWIKAVTETKHEKWGAVEYSYALKPEPLKTPPSIVRSAH